MNIGNETSTRVENERKAKSGTAAVQLMYRFLKDESGATAIEYGLIAAGIALAIIAVINGLGAKLNGKFTSINSSLK